MQRGEVRNPILVLILPMVTCGIYGLIWIFGVMDDLNKGLGREEYNAVKEIALSFLTCGIWAYWLLWRISASVVEVQNKCGVQPGMDAPILFVLSLFGIGPFFMQQGLNNAWENGTPGGTSGGF